MNDLLLVQYLLPAENVPTAGVQTAGTIRALPPGWPVTMVELLDRWDELGPLLRALELDRLEIVEDARLTTPITFPRKVLCAGANYFSHTDEMGTARPDPDATPFFFLKPPTTTVVGPGAVVPLPAGEDPRYDWEGELAVVIGRRARRVSQADARAVVAGYTVADDLSARGRFARPDAVFPPFGYDWLGHKAQDGSCPIGPGIAPAWALPDIEASRLTLTLNGEVQQDTLLQELVIGIDGLVAGASEFTTLEPGDLILTGTPAGVGLPQNRFLSPGDRIEVSIDGIGTLVHTVGPPV
ncbi:fumarylacetoacetate hydrolase family protein [uncultured Friedmanniella sp.]|uniref:fumarylacetoacetate hydrolase family protein n=1 Tax=uncultured Friedmanniella sp. TaxID=335381 RepID=UPI0035CC718E